MLAGTCCALYCKKVTGGNQLHKRLSFKFQAVTVTVAVAFAFALALALALALAGLNTFKRDHVGAAVNANVGCLFR